LTLQRPHAYLDQPLSLAARSTRQLGLQAFVRAGGCPWFGTPVCIDCPLAEFQARTLCDPPDECPTCERRLQCPCGSCSFTRSIAACDLVSS